MDFAKSGGLIPFELQPGIRLKPPLTKALAVRLLPLLLCAALFNAHAVEGLLTNAIDVLSLPAERALSGIPVSLQGVVTAAQADWAGRFFIQDATAGIFVENLSGEQPAPGTLVRVEGVSHPGGFAPIVTQPRWARLGTASLPPARSVSIEQLRSGAEDSQRIEIAGTVRGTRTGGPAVGVEITSGGYRLVAFVPPSAIPDPASLVGARVRVRGTAAAAFKPQVRQLITMNLYVPVAEDFMVESVEPGDPFEEPVVPIESLAQYRRDRTPDQRVHVRGAVTCQRPGQDLFLQDATGGVQVKSRQSLTVQPGTVVEAVGFSDFEQFHPVLQDAVFRETEDFATPVVAEAVTLQELQDGFHHADLVTLRGKVVDRMVRHTGSDDGTVDAERVTLTIQATNYLFTVEGPVIESNARLAEVPLGGTIEVTGICLLNIAEDGGLKSIQMLLPGVDQLRLLRRPSWLTPQRLVVGLTLLSGVLLLAVSWTVTLSRKNRTLKGLIREKVKAQEELQKAHDLLDDRVRERTAQLKFEMTAREQAEVQFKATLAERTRLAQELHDTIEQSLAGIGLQLDTSAKLHERGAGDSRRHLELARTLMTQCQLELRRSIWDLRSRELDQFDLPNVLEVSAREIFEGTGVQVEFQCIGPVQRLSEVVEENLLRIGREALANVIKHAAASRVRIQFEFTPQAVILRVSDNGRGFRPDHYPGANEGHFGLLGIAERTKRLNGHLRVTSRLGAGACIEVEIPIHSSNPQGSPVASDSVAQGGI